MPTAKHTFQIEGKEYTLYFGMASVGIFQQKSLEEVIRMNDSGVKATADNVDKIKTFAYVIYSGLCNWADLQDQKRPAFGDCYILTEEILSSGVDIQNGIWEAWTDSKPVDEMLKRLNGKEKTAQKKSTSKAIGKKLKPTHMGS